MKDTRAAAGGGDGAGAPPSLRKPAWIRARLGGGAAFQSTERSVRQAGLHTVCEEALCPNRGECWNGGRVTVMILGDVCTRGCAFCNVTSGRPKGIDRGEAERVATAVSRMTIKEVVLTSVTRDDLPDGGAAVWADTILAIRRRSPEVTIEVLVPDFAGSLSALDRVADAAPDVLGHNLETVPRLYPVARPQADYGRSLRVLRHAHERGLAVKSGIMLGLGESIDEVHALMADARHAGVDIFFMGQYLQPSRRHLPVKRYVPPKDFVALKREAERAGFPVVVAAPLVRSSYHAGEQTEYLRRLKHACE